MNTTGFPSPAQGYEEESFDFNALLVRHPAATFCMRYTGADIGSCGILHDDILIVDCSVYPETGKPAVVAETDGTFRLALLESDSSAARFRYADQYGTYHTVERLFGIVTGVVRCL
jgi:SOS-response transcriptional repressors (RecA-mediated autopeptidases)